MGIYFIYLRLLDIEVKFCLRFTILTYKFVKNILLDISLQRSVKTFFNSKEN